jgi:hypothetical protein
MTSCNTVGFETIVHTFTDAQKRPSRHNGDTYFVLVRLFPVSIDFKILPSYPLCVVKCAGEVTEADLYDFRSALMLDEKLAGVTMRLYDARRVTKASFSPFTLWRLMSYDPTAGLRRVFVLPKVGVDRVAYRIALRFASGRTNVHVCFDLQEAFDWLHLTDRDFVAAELAV